MMNEEVLQNLSRALTHLLFRNGIVEELHSQGKCLDDETMKQLNKDINNRIYTCLSIYYGGDEDEKENLEKTIHFLAKFFGGNWEKAEKIKIGL